MKAVSILIAMYYAILCSMDFSKNIPCGAFMRRESLKG